VVSIIGRFLEHGRIYYFRNGGDEEYLIGSADCMKRNLESRVEVVVPIDDPTLRAELREVLDSQLAPSRDSWEMQPDGSTFPKRPDELSADLNHARNATRRRAAARAGRRLRRPPQSHPDDNRGHDGRRPRDAEDSAARSAGSRRAPGDQRRASWLRLAPRAPCRQKTGACRPKAIPRCSLKRGPAVRVQLQITQDDVSTAKSLDALRARVRPSSGNASSHQR
jgi:hypothetical protein